MNKFQKYQKKVDDLRKVSDEILKYSEIEGSEVGEYWRSLSDLFHSREMMSKEFQEIYEKELVETLEDIKRNYTIVETIRSYETIDRDLEYTGEG